MTTLQERIDSSKREVFLRRVCEIGEGRARTEVASGALGQQLGLPYEEALRLVGDLVEEGSLERDEALSPPVGPAVRITPRGLSKVMAERAA